jgi:hypothetical protein
MTYVIDMSTPLRNIKGEKLKDGVEGGFLTLGKAITEILLIQENASDKMRNYILAQQCYKAEPCPLNKSDIELIRTAALASKMALLVVGGVVTELDNQVKEAAEVVSVKKVKSIPGETV